MDASNTIFLERAFRLRKTKAKRRQRLMSGFFACDASRLQATGKTSREY
jgi:hypothetical protein